MRKVLAGLSLGLGASATVLALGAIGFLDRAELITYDWRTRIAATQAPANPAIVLVQINDSTVRDLSPVYGRWPWPRLAFANLLGYLHRGQPKVIAVDFTFTEEQRNVTFKYGGDRGEVWSGEESDKALVDAVRDAGNVILLTDANYVGNVGGDQVNAVPEWHSPFRGLGLAAEERPVIVPPFRALADAAHGLAHNFMLLDDDGVARRMPPFVRQGERALPFLGIAAAIAAGGVDPADVHGDGESVSVGRASMPLLAETAPDPLNGARSHVQRTALVNYRIPAFLPDGSRPFKTYEARHLLLSEDQIASGAAPLINPTEFKDKIVFVGQSLSGLVDVFQTPFGSSISGVQLHATIADALLTNRSMRGAGVRARVLATVGGAMLVGLLGGLLPLFAAVAGTAAAMGAWTWFALAAFKGGLWVSLAQPMTAMAAALFAGSAYQYFVEDREKRRVKRLFGRYVSKDVYTQLLENPQLAELGGRRREMTVLFSDIRGFTTITEKGDPQELVAQLNEYFSRMVEILFRHRGTVDKFVGDMVMALFGAPLDDDDHAEHAAAAAVEMVRDLGALNERWLREGRAALDIGIGINSGGMIAGNIGSSSIMSYTVIGDNVNLGSRLESLNKDFRTRIIISDATRARLKGSYDVRPLGDVVVKGKSRPVSIFNRGTFAGSRRSQGRGFMRTAALLAAFALFGAPAHAQLGGALGKLNKAADQAQKVKDLQVSEADERRIGEEVSGTIRKEFGVYQNAAVTKYVTLVGTVLAQASGRPNLKWEFIVLDTDGVNAFAAPGGIVHITRGALGLIKNEAELAGVLGHEVSHVARKHTVNAIQKNRTVQLGTTAVAGSSEYIQAFAKATYDSIVERGFDRGDENDADQEGIRLASKAGYNPSGLASFLAKLMERNTGNADHNGLFASHPETQDRIDRIGTQIKSEKLTGAANGAPRYAATIAFDVKPLAQITPVASGSKGLTGGSGAAGKKEEPKAEEPKKRGLGLSLGNLSKGKQAESTQASASAGGRAVDTDRRAAGGDNPNKLTITVTPPELEAFKKGIV